MRKSTVFISSILTTFALVMLYGVVTAYRGNLAVAATAAPTQEIADTAVAIDTPAAITPTQAAQLAVQVIGHDNLLSAESSTFNGVNAYKITFTNNDVVYVGVDGQILSVQVAPVVVSVQAPDRATNNNRNTKQSQGEHEEHDD